MIKGILIAMGITIGLLIPPVIHFVSGPIGPFIGGFIGVGPWKGRPESAMATGIIFGGSMGLLAGTIWAIVLIALGLATDVVSGGTGAIVIGSAVGTTAYIAALGSAGAAVSAHKARSAAAK